MGAVKSVLDGKRAFYTECYQYGQPKTYSGTILVEGAAENILLSFFSRVMPSSSKYHGPTHDTYQESREHINKYPYSDHAIYLLFLLRFSLAAIASGMITWCSIISTAMPSLYKSRQIVWTSHAKAKMRFYKLSPPRVRHVLHAPKRIEEGVAPKTVAMMQPGSVKTMGQKETWSQEIWVMIQDSPNERRVISARRYPGVTKPRSEIAKSFLRI